MDPGGGDMKLRAELAAMALPGTSRPAWCMHQAQQSWRSAEETMP
jgi:hypothetical protein